MLHPIDGFEETYLARITSIAGRGYRAEDQDVIAQAGKLPLHGCQGGLLVGDLPVQLAELGEHVAGIVIPAAEILDD